MPSRVAYFTRLARAAAYSTAKGIGLPAVRAEAVRRGDHEMVFPYATYSPWLLDADFDGVWSAVQGHTLVDRLRAYGLWQIVGQLGSVPGALLEVGVWRGGTGALIAARARGVGIRAPVYLADTWTGVVKASARDSRYRGGEHADASPQVVRSLVEGTLGLDGVALLVGTFPDDTAAAVPSKLRFCHIDVDTYESARDVLDWTWPRLSVGGVVVFDDYGFASCPGIARLVDERRGQQGQLVVHNLNGHGILVKTLADHREVLPRS